MHECQRADDNGYDKKAHPNAWENPQESVPSVSAQTVGGSSASSNKETADAEETVDAYVAKRCLANDRFAPESAECDAVGDDDQEGEHEPQEIERVVPGVE